MTALPPVSRAWELDQEMRGVIRKLVDGDATTADRTRLHEIIAERARLMLPASPSRGDCAPKGPPIVSVRSWRKYARDLMRL